MKVEDHKNSHFLEIVGSWAKLGPKVKNDFISKVFLSFSMEVDGLEFLKVPHFWFC